jgi:hypothetical protein
MFVMFNSEARASGTFTNSTTFSLTVGGCDYDLEVGFECNITAPFPGEFTITKFTLSDPSCTSTLSASEIARALYDKISDNAPLYLTGCDYDPIPPCNTYGINWISYESFCMKIYMEGPNLIYESCDWDEGYCATEFEYCFNGQIVLSNQVDQWSEDSDCPDYDPNDQPHQQCFRVDTMCD